jgi:lysophospholipase L1-like esterase
MKPLNYAWLLGPTFLVAAGVTMFTLLLLPDFYLDLANRIRWRMAMPSVGQIQLEATLTTIQLRGNAVAGTHAVLLFGDSHLHGLPTSALGENVTNYAIAGEPASRMAVRMRNYESINAAHQIVILSGGNDLMAGASAQQAAESVALAISLIPSKTAVFLVELPPVRGNIRREGAVAALNSELAKICMRHQHCRFIRLNALRDESGQLASAFSSHDGVHLSAAGYQVLVDRLAHALRTSAS